MIHGFSNYIQIHRLIDDIEPEYPIPTNEEEALEYLYFLDRTYNDNAYTTDLIDYEKLIYIELKFSNNLKIQQLIKLIKQNISNNFLFKHKYIQRLTDKTYLNTITQGAYRMPPTNYYNFADLRIKEGEKVVYK